MTSATEQVTQLVLRMQQSRDRGRFDDLADCFAADSEVDISWFTGSGAEWVAESRRLAAGGWGGHSRHRLSPPAVRVRGDRALAELPLAIEFRIDVGGTEADLISYGRSLIRARLTDGCWRIAGFTTVYERDTLVASIPGTRLEVDPGEFAGYRPSYRCLAWHLSRQGLRARPDLLGDDQPETVARQYEADTAWLTAPR
ncbi:nuclear transport factor 2 family protein [Streptomyces sp. Li-HN-5-11]|uniref:nuclear transport factor 2 family protein n=1 Tax=Streptomyces sp. Li-HN-5-11 TaxID=3075432 RepID=UPI0028B0FD01|nr:nuclear transport factor 2 family protein [Streptomyces sp. Li-HN-5-11]WNM31669.1 nuclear transport factor 2 family protein [Streptomyces sp. Li-HN-5-11]